jgi:alkanesulfonate monooxygenase SsuD/methylene tetrahydromethanopterin reductase-like flavin-dependent oxidoreductase (luciferase family)
LPHLYHPIRLAEEVAILDILSNGRVELGIGIGTAFQEYLWFGVAPKERVSTVRETLDILRLAWSGKEFSYHGKHFQVGPVTVTPKPIQVPHPPLLGGAISIEGARRVARWGLPLQWIDRDIGEAYVRAFAEAGHAQERATIDGYLNIFVCDDPAGTWSVVRELYRYQFSRNVLYGLRSVDPTGNVRDTLLPTTGDIERMRGSAFLYVTPDQAIEEIRQRTEGLPVTGLICHNRIPGMPDELSDRHVELMATVVKPAVQEIGIQG